MRPVLANLGLAIAFAACAATPRATVAPCPNLARLAPPPSAECRESPEVSDYERTLGQAVAEVAGSMRVRVEFGERAAIASICAEPPHRSMRIPWRERRTLAEHLGALRAFPEGPACLASARLDLNRRNARLALIERIEWRCRDEARQAALQSQQDRTLPPVQEEVTRRRTRVDCIWREETNPAEARWLFAEQRGRWWEFFTLVPYDRDALLFAPLETSDREPSHIDLVARECRKREELAQLTACMAEHRWELLH